MNKLEKLWSGRFGNLYVDRNDPNVWARSNFFKTVIPSDVKSIHEFGCNRGNNLEALNTHGNYLLSGNDVNDKARLIAQKKGFYVTNTIEGMAEADLILSAGVMIHINPIDLMQYWKVFNGTKYILFIEHKEDSIRTINQRWYKNSMWVMNTGKEFCDRFPYKIIKQGWVNGKKPKVIDYTAPLLPEQGFHKTDYMWLLKKK